MLETLNEQPLACDSQDLLGIEDRRKERNVFHVILPQSLSQGKHLLHAHLGQLPGKHATLKRSVEKEKGGWTLDGSARTREASLELCSGLHCHLPSRWSCGIQSRKENEALGHQLDW